MATLDLLYVLTAHPTEDSENPVVDHLAVIGGPAGRGAVAASRLGADVTLHAMKGSDHFGELLVSLFSTEGVAAAWTSQPGPSQHSCVIVSAETGLRTTIWTPQPRATADLIASLRGVLSGFGALLLDCTDEGLTTAGIAAARAVGVPVVMDTGSFKPWSEPLLDGVDYLITPEKFLRAHQPREDDVVRAARRAYDQFGPRAFGVTQGSRGGFFVDGSGVHEFAPVPVHAVDTCGAGDSFHGAFAWAIAAGASATLAFTISAWVAACKCAVLGNGGLPDRARLDAFLSDLP